jgi:hypothetical protein
VPPEESGQLVDHEPDTFHHGKRIDTPSFLATVHRFPFDSRHRRHPRHHPAAPGSAPSTPQQLLFCRPGKHRDD